MLAAPPQEEAQSLLAHLAQYSLDGERQLHTYISRHFAAPPGQEKMPACFAYTSYLLALASQGGYGQMLAWLLPRAWVYERVGLHISARSASVNPCQVWIDTYADPEFAKVTRQAICLVDQAAAEATAKQQEQMLEVFVVSTWLEYLFWDDAYQLRTWGI